MSEDRLYRMTLNKGEPSSWKVEHYANIGTSELFVFRFAMEIPRILDATLIMDEERDKAKEAIATFMKDGLMPAFEHLRAIRMNVLKPPPELNRRQAYEDFIRTLWAAYKGLFQQATRHVGLDVKFLFLPDKEFEAGLKKNLAPEFGQYLRQQRTAWQNDLSRIRNDYLEHRKLDWEDVKRFYCVEAAEKFFEGVWTTAEEILIGLIQNRLPEMCGIREIPAEKRNPNNPYRFEFVLFTPLP